MFWFVVLLLVLGAGFYFYQKLTAIEREIRAEQVAEKEQVARPQKTEDEDKPPKPELEPQREEALDPPFSSPEVEKMTANAAPVPDEGMSTEEEIVLAVTNLPGIKQTELYDSFPDVDRKRLQQLVKELADSGKLKREKQGSSYILYPG